MFIANKHQSHGSKRHRVGGRSVGGDTCFFSGDREAMSGVYISLSPCSGKRALICTSCHSGPLSFPRFGEAHDGASPCLLLRQWPLQWALCCQRRLSPGPFSKKRRERERKTALVTAHLLVWGSQGPRGRSFLRTEPTLEQSGSQWMARSSQAQSVCPGLFRVVS